MISVKKILIPIDRSEYKKKIVEYAFSLSKAWNAEITAIHVIHMGRAVGYGSDEQIKLEKIQAEIRHGEDLLNEIDLTAKKQGINIKTEVLEEYDTVAKTINEYAKKTRWMLL